MVTVFLSPGEPRRAGYCHVVAEIRNGIPVAIEPGWQDGSVPGVPFDSRRRCRKRARVDAMPSKTWLARVKQAIRARYEMTAPAQM
jgi:hypothetical protein